MPTHVTLVNWTDQGIRNVKESPARLDAYKEAAKAAGVKVKDFYLVNGRYDMVIITETANEESAVKLALATASRGAVRTETLRAFTENEYRKMIADLP